MAQGDVTKEQLEQWTAGIDEDLKTFLETNDNDHKDLTRILHAADYTSMELIAQAYKDSQHFKDEMRKAGLDVPVRIWGTIARLFLLIDKNYSKQSGGGNASIPSNGIDYDILAQKILDLQSKSQNNDGKDDEKEKNDSKCCCQCCSCCEAERIKEFINEHKYTIGTIAVQIVFELFFLLVWQLFFANASADTQTAAQRYAGYIARPIAVGVVTLAMEIRSKYEAKKEEKKYNIKDYGYYTDVLLKLQEPLLNKDKNGYGKQ